MSRYYDAANKCIVKIESATPGRYISRDHYDEISMYIKDSFLYDHKSLLEGFNLYQILTPRMQTKFINHFFADFMKKFENFIGPCEEGFRNELIIQMNVRRLEPNQEVVAHGSRFDKLYFIVDGKIDLITQPDQVNFLAMHPGMVFGDYSILFDLKSNITWKTPDVQLNDSEQDMDENLTKFLCCDKQIFISLCELYSKTYDALRVLAIEKRDIIGFFCSKARTITDMKVPGIPVGLSSSPLR